MYFLLEKVNSIAMLVYWRVPPLGEGLEYPRDPYIACEAHHGIVRSVHVAQLADNQALMELVHKARFFGSIWDAKKPVVGSSYVKNQIPKHSMYGICTYTWFIFRVNVGKYTIHLG